MSRISTSAARPAPLALVVEDDADAAEVAAGMLGLLGYRARIAPDGNTALQMLSEARPDLVLLDICLPQLDGIMLMQVAERFVDLKGVPVVAASAVYASEGTEARILAKMGVTSYLPKPFNMASLRAAIEAADPHARLAPPPSPAPAAPRPEPARKAPEVPISFRIDDIVGKLSTSEGETTALLLKTVGDELILRTTGGVPHEGEALRLQVLHRHSVNDSMRETTVRIIGTAFRVREEAPGARVRMHVSAAAPAESWRSIVRLLELKLRD